MEKRFKIIFLSLNRKLIRQSNVLRELKSGKTLREKRERKTWEKHEKKHEKHDVLMTRVDREVNAIEIA